MGYISSTQDIRGGFNNTSSSVFKTRAMIEETFLGPNIIFATELLS